MKAVIQAGGKGSRLKPYTLVLPKPLMPVGNFPVIELLIKWLRRNGIKETFVTTGYLGHLIKALCGDGRQWDIDIEYSEETEPLGTVGALNLVRSRLDQTFLVVNGDLLSDLNLKSFIEYHRSHDGILTIGVTEKSVQVDMGVIETKDNVVIDFKEKPMFTHDVSMGVYCMEPEVLRYIPKGVPFGFDYLMYRMLEAKDPVHVYRHKGMWMDVGRLEDFQKAQELFDKGEIPMLGV